MTGVPGASAASAASAGKARRPRKGSEPRRRAILEAALACFAEKGYAAATLGDIRARAGASTGSIYHHFTAKEDLAAALYVEALRRYQDGFLAALARRRTAERGVRGMVEYHLRFVARRREWARFLLDMRRSEGVASVEPEIRRRTEAFVRAVLDWLRPHVERGEIVRLPADLYVAAIIGPCHEFARWWLAGRTRTSLALARRLLAGAAFAAVRGPATG